MTEESLWIWMQNVLGEGASLSAILEYFNSPKALYDASENELKMTPVLSSKQISRIMTTPITVSEEVIYNCNLNGWKIITYSSSDYPQRLKEISNPPAVLYVDGDLPDIDSLLSIGIVGTRKASEYAVMAANLMSQGITMAGGLVISGGALGIDSAAHKGAILSNGKTVAVLGCGFGSSYLKSNKSLRDVIRVNGALVTEYPPFTSASKYNFPMRNRIISGLSVGVLVVEAGVKSGSLITANLGMEQGRDVFAVPGSVLSQDFAGTNKLIEDGAYVATTPQSIICHYTETFGNLNVDNILPLSQMMQKKTMPQPNIPKEELIKAEEKFSFDNLESGRAKRLERENISLSLTGDNKKVFDMLSDTYANTEELSLKCSLPVNKVLSALTQLEMLGLAVSAAGKRYKLA